MPESVPQGGSNAVRGAMAQNLPQFLPARFGTLELGGDRKLNLQWLAAQEAFLHAAQKIYSYS